MSEPKSTFKEKMISFASKAGALIKRRKKLFITLVSLLVVGGVVLGVVSSMRNAAAVIEIPQTYTLTRMDLEQIVSGTGIMQSSLTREVTSSLTYEITEVYVAEGDRVQKNQILAQLDTTEINKLIADTRQSIADAEAADALALAQAERKLQDAINTRDINKTKNDRLVAEALDALEAATRDFEAAKQTYGDGSPEAAVAEAAMNSAQDAYNRAVETRDTTYRNDSLSVENALDAVNNQKQKDSAANYRSQLEGYLEDKENCAIKAPVAGTVTAITAEAGNSAGGMGGASVSLFTIEDTDHLEITAFVPEYDAPSVKAGLPVHITSDAIDGEVWEGTVKSVSVTANENSNFTVVVSVTSPVGSLTIGMSAKFNIVTASKNNVFAVPYDAVTTNAAGESVIYVYGGGEGMGGPPEGMQNPPNNLGGSPQVIGTPQSVGQAPANVQGEGTANIPIVVQTGMETDYYIEISSPLLAEGMVILADPEGRNVNTGTTGIGGFPLGGGF